MADRISVYPYKFCNLFDFKTNHDEKFRLFLGKNYPNNKYLFIKKEIPNSTYLQDYGNYSLYQTRISNENVICVIPIKS